MLQKRNTPVLRFRNLIFKDVLGVLEDWGFDHIKCFTFITQILEGHKISLKIRITGSNGLMISPKEVLPEDFCFIWYPQNLSVLYEK